MDGKGLGTVRARLACFPIGESYFFKVIFLPMENPTFRKKGLKSGSQDAKKGYWPTVVLKHLALGMVFQNSC